MKGPNGERRAGHLCVWPVAVQAAVRRVARVETAILRAQMSRDVFRLRDLKIRLGAATAELEAAKAAALAVEGLDGGSGHACHTRRL